MSAWWQNLDVRIEADNEVQAKQIAASLKGVLEHVAGVDDVIEQTLEEE